MHLLLWSRNGRLLLGAWRRFTSSSLFEVSLLSWKSYALLAQPRLLLVDPVRRESYIHAVTTIFCLSYLSSSAIIYSERKNASTFIEFYPKVRPLLSSHLQTNLTIPQHTPRAALHARHSDSDFKHTQSFLTSPKSHIFNSPIRASTSNEDLSVCHKSQTSYAFPAEDPELPAGVGAILCSRLVLRLHSLDSPVERRATEFCTLYKVFGVIVH